MLKEKIYLVLGIGTDVGKTYLVENLCRAIPDSLAIKPIVSGFGDDDKNSDPAKILTALNLKISQKNFDMISPWRFELPVSPNFAGKISFEEVKSFCLKKILLAKEKNKFLFVESAGGVMTPINQKKTFLDLAKVLKIPVLLVSANYLGAISHTLSAAAILKNEKIMVEKIILNEIFLSKIKSSSLAKTIKTFTKIEVILMKNLIESLIPKHIKI